MSCPTCVCFPPRFLIVVETVVLGDPAVHLDPSPLLLPEKSHEERPGDPQRIHRIKHLTNHLGADGDLGGVVFGKAKRWFNILFFFTELEGRDCTLHDNLFCSTRGGECCTDKGIT